MLVCEDYPSIQAAISVYLADAFANTRLNRLHAAALAITGLLTHDQVALTNHPWSFSFKQLHQNLAIDRLVVINDFAAAAIAIPYLQRDARYQIGGAKALAAASTARRCRRRNSRHRFGTGEAK